MKEIGSVGRVGTSSRRILGLTWLLLGVVAIARVGPNLEHMVRAFRAHGPNTVGEAGKVYYAHKVQVGQSAFASGDEPPYYPSVHGSLLHASVGMVGRLSDATPTALYAIGRWMSLLMTLLAWAALAALGLRLGIPWPALAVGAVLWLSTYPLVEHTVSYRPDNWVFMLSALACWLMAARPERRWALVMLALIPAVAFHIKATGLVLVGAIGLVHLARKQWLKGVVLGAAQVGVVGVSVLALDRSSGGLFLQGLRGAGKVSWDWNSLLLPNLLSLGDPMIPLMILGPLVLGIWALRTGGPAKQHSTFLVVGCFWAVTLLGYGLATVRAGSALYYFLEPATYGLLILLYTLHLGTSARALWRFRLSGHLAVLAVAAVGVPAAMKSAGQEHDVDVSLLRTELLGAYRESLAERVNAQDGICYSDDPGLNVLLDQPAVIYPLLQLQMVQNGAISPGTLPDPVTAHDYRCVIFSGIDWRYRGQSVVPAEFRSLVTQEYPWIEIMGQYSIHYREQDPLPG